MTLEVETLFFGIEVEYLLKSQVNHLKSVMEKIEQHHVERLKLHTSNFEYREDREE